MARGEPEMRIRLPKELKDWVAAEAKRSLRTQTAQIVALLSAAKEKSQEK